MSESIEVPQTTRSRIVSESTGIPYVPAPDAQRDAARAEYKAQLPEEEDAADRQPDSFLWTPEEVAKFRDDRLEHPSKGGNKELGQLIGKKLLDRRADDLIAAADYGSQDLVLVSEAEVMSRPAPEWWIPDLIQKGTVAVFAGEAGIGKSFMAIHMTRCVATGLPFFQSQVKKGTVLYVAAEGASSFGKRVRAWDEYHHVSPAPGSISYLEAGVNLSDPLSVKRLEDLLDTLQPDLIILDTLSQLAAIENENDAAQLAKVFRVAKQLRDHKEGSSVILVHHVNKGAGGVRGSSVIRSNADTVIVAKSSNGGQFYLTTEISADGKQKDGSPVKLDGFKLIDHKGSAVVYRDAPAPDDNLTKLRELFADGAALTKLETMRLWGVPKADSGKEHKAFTRLWENWTEGDGAILLPVEGTKGFKLLSIAL